MSLLSKVYTNSELNLSRKSRFIAEKQNAWFEWKEIVTLLGYQDTDKAVRQHVDEENKKSYPVVLAGQVRCKVYINEPGFYCLICSSKLETAKMGNRRVRPSIRKIGYFKLFDSPYNKCFNWKWNRSSYKSCFIYKMVLPGINHCCRPRWLQDTSKKNQILEKGLPKRATRYFIAIFHFIAACASNLSLQQINTKLVKLNSEWKK